MITLGERWNLIGCPADTPAESVVFVTADDRMVAWVDAVAERLIEAWAYGWDTEALAYFTVGAAASDPTATDFAEGRGYWLCALAPNLRLVWNTPPRAPG